MRSRRRCVLVFLGIRTMNKVAVIGLGYVGLPLVVAFGKQMKTIGFDIALAKVESCQRGVDPSRELPDSELQAAVHAEYTADPTRNESSPFHGYELRSPALATWV